MSQYAAIEAMKNGDDDIEYMKSQYDMRRRLIVDGLNSMGLRCFEPEGAFYVFPSVRSTGLTSMEFSERLIYSKRVAVVPGDAFGACGGRICADFLLLFHQTYHGSPGAHGSVPEGLMSRPGVRDQVWFSRCAGYGQEELNRQVEEAFTFWGQTGDPPRHDGGAQAQSGDELQTGSSHCHPSGCGGRRGKVRPEGRRKGGHRGESRRALYSGSHEGHFPGLRLHGHGSELWLCSIHRLQKAERFLCLVRCGAVSFPWRSPFSPGIT